MNKQLLIIALLAACFSATAQSEYRVERDSAGLFVLLQNGNKTPFDTAFVAASALKKQGEEADVKAEIDLLERLVLLRRQRAVIKEERNTLEDILKKARNAKH